MNIIHKYLAAAGVILLFIAVQACGAEEKSAPLDVADDAQCIAARNGELDDKILQKVIAENNAHLNAQLLDCAVQVTIGEADTSKEMRRKVLANKQKVANKLLTKNLDVGYVNEYNNTLLMTVIQSFFDDEWKLSTAKKLIDLGVDTNHVNKYNNRALELAKIKKAEDLVKLLESQSNN